MKIISKYKDFYDYLVGVYGQDPVLVYDRRHSDQPIALTLPAPHLEEQLGECAEHKLLCIGGEYVHLFVNKNQILTHWDLLDEEEFFIRHRYNYRYWLATGEPIETVSFRKGKNWVLLSDIDEPYARLRGENVRAAPEFARLFGAEHADVPILLLEQDGRTVNRDSSTTSYRIWKNPCLQSLGIYLDPDWVWRTLSQFLSDVRARAEVRGDAPDALKIINKGFDQKFSFRPKMRR